MLSPLGFGFFLAEKKNLLLVSSNESQLKEILEEDNNLTKTSSIRFQEVFKNRDTISAFYIDFKELGLQFESVKGLLEMYLKSENKDFKSPFTQDKIQALKRLGRFVSYLKRTDEDIILRGFYAEKNQ